MKKGDVFIISTILISAVLIFALMNNDRDAEKYFVEIIHDGKIVEQFELTDDIDRIIELNYTGYNKLQVKDGYLDMIEADCPDKVDVHRAPITYGSWNRKIICAPNKIIVSIVGGGDDSLDAVM